MIYAQVSVTESSSPSTLDVVRAGLASATAVVLLFSPDEEVRLVPNLAIDGNDESGVQPRPNVIFEAGLAFAIAPERTIIVQLGKPREISDISGVNYIRLSNDAVQRKNLLERLRTAGCQVDEGGEWFNVGVAGDFTF